MTVPTVTDFDNAKLDLTTISNVANVNYVGNTTTNRNSVVIDTLTGRLSKLGYIPPIAYAAAISFGAMNNVKTIDRLGIVYAPLPTSLPFTTTGTWATDSTNFFVVQSQSDTVRIDNLVTLSGVPANSVNNGTFTGPIIPDNVTTKAAIQSLETPLDAMRKLSGVALNAVNLGTFAGVIIPDNVEIKAALQALETAIGVSVTSGNWTPTITNPLLAITAATPQLCRYTRIGNIVTINGTIQITVSSIVPNNAGSFRISLPIASNFTTVFDSNMTGSCSKNDYVSATIQAQAVSATDDILIVIANLTATGAYNLQFTGSYIVQ